MEVDGRAFFSPPYAKNSSLTGRSAAPVISPGEPVGDGGETARISGRGSSARLVIRSAETWDPPSR